MVEPGIMGVDVPEIDGSAEDIGSRHANQPRPDDRALYGLIGEFGRIAATSTEVNPFAAAMGLLSFLSSIIGRDVYFSIGNTFHHARLFSLHVGRSSKGRKGDSLSLAWRVKAAMDAELLGQCHSGGLSSREGLVLLIHDGYTVGGGKNEREIPPIDDKRLWIVESEFANVLHQTKRDGNTLSAALRDCWDGKTIAPATKTNRISATDPHIALHGNVTPSELISLIQSRELSNGFANRFLIFWAERSTLVPFPEATPDDVVLHLARRIEEVIRFANGRYPAEQNTRRMSMTPNARALYERLYRAELNRADGGELITGLLDRRAPTLIRIAMILALTDKTLLIDQHHIEAAMAWVRYWADSVYFIFKDMAENATEAERKHELAEKIIEFLQGMPEGASRKEIYRDCFNNHESSSDIGAAIDALLAESPPKVEAFEAPRIDGKKGRGSTRLRFLTDGRVLSVLSELTELVGPELSPHDCALSVLSSESEYQSTQSTQNKKTAETCANSLSEQSTQPATKKVRV
jgi:hypothetical protein